LAAKRRAAILTETPNQTVISSIYKLKLQDLPFIVKIFSTVSAALNWVGLTFVDKEKIENEIKKMKINAC